MAGDSQNRPIDPPPPPPPPPPAPGPFDASDELDRLDISPSFRNPNNSRKRLSKQLSMHEAPRYKAWERRRRRILDRERRPDAADGKLTDDDLKELKGCIELGFGFNEESGQRLCPTIPALDLYLAVNRQFWTSPVNSPSSARSAGGSSSSSGSPMSDSESSQKMFNPGDDPQQVKTRLRHWAQAVACSVLQSPPLRGGGEMDYSSMEKER